MKKIIPVLTLCFVLSLFGCNTSNKGNSSSSSNGGNSSQTSSEQSSVIPGCNTSNKGNSSSSSNGGNSSQTSSEQSSVIPEKPYTEAPDSLDGVDATDLSALKDAFDAITTNYKNVSETFYNEEAVRVANSIFKTNYIQDRTTLVTENYRYGYKEDGSVNEGYVNDLTSNKFYKLELLGDTLEDKLNSTISEEGLTANEDEGLINDMYFGFEDLNSAYVDTYEWTRVSGNKYRCDNKEVCESFMQLTALYCPYGGAYMTFSHVTVELDLDDEIDMRVRVYASNTQSGKMIPDHLKAETKPNWYMLFTEALISDVDEVSIPAFENYLNPTVELE